MRVFVTGASGFVGTAVTAELLEHGHQVLGLARSEHSAEIVRALGAEPVLGTIEQEEVLRRTAARVDAVVHLAFNHDFSRFDDSARVEAAAITALGEGLSGTGTALAIASGVAGLAPGVVATEADRPAPGGRATGADIALSLAERGVRSTVVRLAPTVHDAIPAGFVQRLAEIARTVGSSDYIGDGAARWPAVHRTDAARLFRLAIEHAEPGSVLHAIGENGIPTKTIAQAVGELIGVPTASISEDEGPQRFGFLSGLLAMDGPASSDRTRTTLGWDPTGRGLIEDIRSWA